MAINRNLIFLESFSVILVISVFGNVEEFVRTLISDHPNSYFIYLIGYVVIVAIVIFGFYKITYRTPRYEKLINKSQQRQTLLIDGLKSKIDTIDEKKKKQEEKKQAKLREKVENVQEKEQEKDQTRVQKTKSSIAKPASTFSTSRNLKSSTNSKSTSKSKTVRRRK